jgi:segregation and condensation protein A
MDYTVKLDNFSGPLDLLLYLIKQDELEIHEISLSHVCDKYLEHIRSMKDLDVNVSAEFLVVAATLMVIKSRSLLPQEQEIDIDEELDPEDELIQQLLEYKKFKAASRDLVEMADLRSRIYPYVPPRASDSDAELPLEDIDLVDLVRAFAKLLSETRLDRLPRLLRNDKPIREYIEEVFAQLLTERSTYFYDLFRDTRDRDTVIGRFIALLELAKRGRVAIVQDGSYDTIRIELTNDSALSETEMDQMESDVAASPIQEAEEPGSSSRPSGEDEDPEDAEEIAAEINAELEARIAGIRSESAANEIRVTPKESNRNNPLEGRAFESES